MATFLDTREWFGYPGANAAALKTLRSLMPSEVPDSYLELLALSDGGEGPLPVQPYSVCLDDVSTMLANICEEWHADWLRQGFFVIGGNGGGELIAFDVRSPGTQSLVSIDLVAGAASAETVVDTWAGFVNILGTSGP